MGFIMRFFFYLLFISVISGQARGFNLFSEFFNDLKYGSLNNEYLKQKLELTSFKCHRGSYSFNGSCYFISNRRSLMGLEVFQESDSLTQNLLRFSQRSRQNVAKSLKQIKPQTIGIPLVDLTNMPSDATWIAAQSQCNQLNNDSNLIAFDNNEKEYEFVVDLLFRINFPSLLPVRTSSPLSKYINQEQKYFIGLTYNNSAWKWLSGQNLSEEMVTKFELDKVKQDAYRKCSYLNLRDDGNINIELTNCNNDKHPYICKYVVDRCFNNTNCGENGECVNLPSKKSFECRCRIFYEGDKCQRWSNQGIQMIIAVALVVTAFLAVLAVKIASRCKIDYKGLRKRKTREPLPRRISFKNANAETTDRLLVSRKGRQSILTLETNFCLLLRKNVRILVLVLLSLLMAISFIFTITFVRSRIILARIERFQNSISNVLNPNSIQLEDIDKNSTSSRLTTFFSLDFCKIMNDQFLEDYFIVYVSLSLTIFIYVWNSLRSPSCRNCYCCSDSHGARDHSMNEQNGTNCSFFQRAAAMMSRLCESACCKKLRCCAGDRRWACDVEFPVPMNPFSKRNRFITSVIYAAYTYNILKIFEHLLVGSGPQVVEMAHKRIRNISKSHFVNGSLEKEIAALSGGLYVTENGILTELLKQICNVFIIGFRYYPILLCVELKRKSKVCYLACTFYVLFQLVYYVYMNLFCLLSAYQIIVNTAEKKRLFGEHAFLDSFGLGNLNFLANQSSFQVQFNVTHNNGKNHTEPSPGLSNQATNLTTSGLLLINNSLFWSNFMYEKFLFYAVLCLISFYMVVEFARLVASSVVGIKSKRSVDKKPAETRPNSHYYAATIDDVSIDERGHEINYTKQLLCITPVNKPISYSKYLFEKYIYKNKPDFRFSKQFINTTAIAFVLLYYITSLIIRKSNLIVSFSGNLLVLLINGIFMGSLPSETRFLAATNQLSSFLTSMSDNISWYLVFAACFTTFMYVVQLMLGIRNYHRQVLNAYKGVYVDIPSPKKFSNAKLAASSLHFSGYAIGYLLWGYLILFEVCLVFIIVVRFLIKFHFIAENIAKIVLPILTIYLFKKILIWYVCRYFLVNNQSNKTLFLKNRRLYFVLNHFNFFFDCFLGSFVCLMRMAKSSLAALFFMPRLDYSIFGRYLEHTDLGFISYVSFIHMEVSQSHPVKLAFCQLLKEAVNRPRRKKWCQARNRWALAVTLSNNPFLKRQRKKYLDFQKLVPAVESFEQFLERQIGFLFFKNDAKKKSKSSPCLLEENNYYMNLQNTHYIAFEDNLRKPPKVAPRQFIRKTDSFRNTDQIERGSPDNYYQNLDSTYISDLSN